MHASARRHVHADRVEESPSARATARPTTPLIEHAGDGTPWIAVAGAVTRADALGGVLARAVAQRGQRCNRTGLPDTLKAGVEQLSGHSLDDARVHLQSDRPAQLHARAFVEGTNIYVSPGEERHLAHEAWHVVQQKQGRVSPAGLVHDPTLEREADLMGARALIVGRTAPAQETMPAVKPEIRPPASAPAIQAVLNLNPDPVAAPNGQSILVGLIRGTYTAPDNKANLDVDAGNADRHLTRADMLEVAEGLDTVMRARLGYANAQPGVLELHPTGAVVTKTVVELLGGALGGSWSKLKAWFARGSRIAKWAKEGKPAIDKKAPKLHPDTLPEHFALLDSLRGDGTVSIQPVLPGTYKAGTDHEFFQDMMLTTAEGNARYEKYKQHAADNPGHDEEDLTGGTLGASLIVKLTHDRLPAVIEVLRKRG
jgi:hypothetical protein